MNLLLPIIRIIKNHKPADENEGQMRDQMLSFVLENADCLYRSLLSGHLTASAWVTDPELKSVLMIHHRKLNRWLQPGGHADGDPDLAGVALKEVLEETGIQDIKMVSKTSFDLDIHLIPERKGVPAHYHHDFRFHFYGDPGQRLDPNHETRGAKWVLLNEIEEMIADESVMRMVRKTLDLKKAQNLP